jgi:hypothetical protein
MTPAGLLGTLSDWYERNQDKLVGSGIRGAATRGLLGLEPPKDATKAEMEAYRNFAKASMALAAGPVAATRAVKGAKTLKNAPQAEALETARQNAVKMLGLPESNTAMDRAKAMGFDTPAVHFSRHGVDVRELDSGKFAIAPFDAVGTHVGSPQAAMERFQNTVGYKVNNPSYALDELKGVTYPVVIRKGKEFLSVDKPWNEDALSAELRKRGGHNWADVNRGGKTYPEMNEALRQKLFQEYGAIPYINDVEAKGQISYIVPPKNIRSRFAAFDPARIDEKDLLASLAAMGITLPLTMGLLSDQTD